MAEAPDLKTASLAWYDRVKINATPALGHTIIGMSVLLSLKLPTALVTRADGFSMANDIKRIFNINDQDLIVEPGTLTEVQNQISIRDSSKVFSPYLTSPDITVFEKTYLTGKHNKPCIAFVMDIGASGTWSEFPSDKFPYNRYHPRESYLGAMKLAIEAGYEVITLSQPHHINIEHKILLLNEYCDAVVTYKGGVAHLAHCLNIPTFILPWTHDLNGNSGRSLEFQMHSLHLDRKTWFLQSFDELLAWTPDEFRQKINSLHAGQGNNMMYSDRVKFYADDFKFQDALYPESIEFDYFDDYEIDFFKQYLQPTDIYRS